MSSTLSRHENVRLGQLEEQNQFLLDSYKKNPGIKQEFLKILHSEGNLWPQSELFWRIDRGPTEYKHRFGFDPKGFLERFSTPHQTQLCLELGQGSGNFKKEIDELDGYACFSICNKMHYSLLPVIMGLLNFEKIENNSGPLTNEDREQLGSLIHKLVLIKEGQTHLDSFDYDQEAIKSLQNDLSNLKNQLFQKSSSLESATVIPHDKGELTEEGIIIYPHKISLPTNASFQKACTLFAKDAEKYLHNNNDLMGLVDAYPLGTLIGDFSQIRHLENGQLDFIYGVRSTVYLSGDSYISFISDLTDKLSADGVLVDDSVRENYGWRYRIEELQKVSMNTGREIQVISGPGILGEDYGDKSVPMAFVVTQCKEKLQDIQQNLSNGYQMIHLKDF